MRITSWQQQLRDTIKKPEMLLRQLELASENLPQALEALKKFPLRVPRSFINRMRRQDLLDPLLRQVYPYPAEDNGQAKYKEDPIGELIAETSPGVIHKYHGRALLVTTGVCAIHCRYCFRRHFPYEDSNAAKLNWQPALEYLSENTSISEIILSGGDPLVLTDDKLANLVRQLAQIPHLKRLRIHTRMPVVVPSRISEALIDWLTQTRLKPIIVIHVNHPNELNDEVFAALSRLRQSQVPLLNQSVLLKGVNDNLDVLTQLSDKLFDYGVLPYYLHMLDRVAGASHFEVSEQAAKKLLQGLMSTLPGYLVPKLVREESQAPYKIPLI